MGSGKGNNKRVKAVGKTVNSRGYILQGDIDKNLTSLTDEPLPQGFFKYDHIYEDRGKLKERDGFKYYSFYGSLDHEIIKDMEDGKLNLHPRNHILKKYAQDNKLMNRKILKHYSGSDVLEWGNPLAVVNATNYILEEYMRELAQLGVINFDQEMQDRYEIKVMAHYDKRHNDLDVNGNRRARYKGYLIDRKTGLYLNNRYFMAGRLWTSLRNKYYVSHKAYNASFLNSLTDFLPNKREFVTTNENSEKIVWSSGR